MLDPARLQKDRKKLLRVIREKYAIQSDSAERAFARIGRRLPRSLRAKAAVLVHAEQVMGQPKLMMQMDDRAYARAYTDVMGHLESLSRMDMIKGRALDIGVTVGGNLIAAFALVVFVLWWRGALP